MKKVKELFKNLHRDESGNYFVEIALALIGISLVIYGAVNSLATDGINPTYEGIKNELLTVQIPSL